MQVEANDGNLSDTATIIVNIIDKDDSALGTHDEQRNAVRLRPNPTQEFISVEWDYFERTTISELSGKQLFESNAGTLDLRALNAGVYLVTLIGTSDEQLRFRIIKR